MAKLVTFRRAASSRNRGSQQALRRNENKMMVTGGELALDLTNFGEVDAAVNRRGRITGQAQRIDLVFHQRDERRDHDVGAPGNRRRHLIAQRLAAAGRHHDQRVAAFEAGSDRLQLQRPQAFKSPKTPQNGKDCVRRAQTRAGCRDLRLNLRLHRLIPAVTKCSGTISNNISAVPEPGPHPR